jgi:hypothetical protein
LRREQRGLPNSVALHRPAYCRLVLDLMRRRAPAEVARQEKFYGQSLDELLFVREGDQKYRQNESLDLTADPPRD